VEAGETDPSVSPEPVPEGFPEDRPHHDQVRPDIPEGEEGEPADPGDETHPGEHHEGEDRESDRGA
jgi:hypothetical protein